MSRHGKCTWEMAAMPWLSWRTSPRRCIEDVRLFVNPRHWLTWPHSVVFIAVCNKCVILLSKRVTLNAAPCMCSSSVEVLICHLSLNIFLPAKVFWFAVTLCSNGRGSPKFFTVWIHDRLSVPTSEWFKCQNCYERLSNVALLRYVSVPMSLLQCEWSVFWTVRKPSVWLAGNFPPPVPNKFCTYFTADVLPSKYTGMPLASF